MSHNQLFRSGNESIVGRGWELATRGSALVSTGSVSMEIDVANDNGTTIIRPGGERLDIEVAPQFRAALLSLIEQGNRRLVIDLNDINFIDSSGLGALVSALKTLKRTDGAGDLRLTRVQPPVTALLEIIRLNRVFTSYDSVEQAVQSFASLDA